MKVFFLPKFLLYFTFLLLPFTFIKLFLNFSLSDLFILMAFLFVFCMIMIKKIKIEFITRNIFLYPIILFSSGFFLSLSNSTYPIESVTAYMQIVFIFIICHPIISLYFKFNYTLKPIIVLFLVSSMLVTFTLITFFFLKIDVSLGLFLIEEGWRGRFSYGGMEPNVPARIVLQTIPFFAIFIIISKKKIFKTISFFFLVLSVIAVVTTASRSGLLTTLLGFILFVVFVKRMSPNFKIPRLLISITIFLYIFFLVSSKLNTKTPLFDRATARYSTILSPSKSFSSRERIQLIDYGIEYLYSNPFVGLGLSNSYLYTGRSIHNPILLSWVENGIFGFFGFASIYLILILIGVKCWQNKFFNDYYLLSFTIIMLMMIFGDMFMANTYKRILWLPTLIFVSYFEHISKKNLVV
jgi:O-antigen ligase